MSQIPPSSPQEPTPPLGEPSMPPEFTTPAVTPIETNKDARMWGMICHLAAFAGLVGVPAGNILGPLVAWLIKKNEFPFVERNGKESLNWQITLMIGILISIPLILACGIGFFTMGALMVLDIVYVIIAAIKTNEGNDYKYPWSIKFIK